MNHLTTTIEYDDLPGGAAEAIAEIRDTFPGPVPDPIRLHAIAPRALEAYWHMSKAVYFSGNHFDREDKDIIASGVSASNGCSYCLEAHAGLVRMADRESGNGMAADDAGRIADVRRRRLFLWARATMRPDASEVRHPPFVAPQAAEVIGVALMFHYTNRLVNIFMPDSPIQLPPIPGLKRLVMWLARPQLRRLATREQPRPLPQSGLPSADFSWAERDAVIHSSFSAFDRVITQMGSVVASDRCRAVVLRALQAWRGTDGAHSTDWIEQQISALPPEDQAAGRLAMRCAIASREVTKHDIDQYQHDRPGDGSLVRLLMWSSFQATKRVGSWLWASADCPAP